MIKILFIIHIIVGILLIISILMQKTSSDGISNLAGNNSGLVSAASAANFLTRITIVLAAAFMINSIILGNLSTKKTKSNLAADTKIHQQREVEEIPIAK
jgi:preprotein translocase subunit SecG